MASSKSKNEKQSTTTRAEKHIDKMMDIHKAISEKAISSINSDGHSAEKNLIISIGTTTQI